MDLFTSISRDPKYQKVNDKYLIKKLRYEFDKIGTVRPLCKGSLNLQPGSMLRTKLRPAFKSSTRKKNSKKRSIVIFSSIESICIKKEFSQQTSRHT